jgi:hypothetical protein
MSGLSAKAALSSRMKSRSLTPWATASVAAFRTAGAKLAISLSRPATGNMNMPEFQ